MGVLGPANEICDALDNDCDGYSDEGFPVGEPCGLGACAGVWQCDADGLSTHCNGGSPTIEACNGIDDDCDGSIDSGCPWAKRAGTGQESNGFDAGFAIAAGPDGGAVVAGVFSDHAVFGSGEPNETTLPVTPGPPPGPPDLFVARYMPSGQLAWVTSAGGWGQEHPSGVVVLPDESTTVTGWFEGDVTFGRGEPGEVTFTSLGADDIFIARYDSTGHLLWAKSAGGSWYDQSAAVAAMPDGGVVATGYVNDVAWFGQGEPNETAIFAGGYAGNAFLARYSADGDLTWANQIATGSWTQEGLGVATYDDGAIVVTGLFEDETTFAPGGPHEATLDSFDFGDGDVFVARFTESGTMDWVKQAGGISRDQGEDVAALPDGGALATGSFRTATFGPGEPGETLLSSAGGSDVFVASFAPDGSLRWVKGAGGAYDDLGSGIAGLADGTALVTGQFSYTATFGQGEPGETSLQGMQVDIFVCRHASTGLLDWVVMAGGPGWDRGVGIAALANGQALVTGDFEDTATFFEGLAGETSLTAAGSYDPDIFVAKFPR